MLRVRKKIKNKIYGKGCTVVSKIALNKINKKLLKWLYHKSGVEKIAKKMRKLMSHKKGYFKEIRVSVSQSEWLME